jgi:hypothetical protein
MKIFRTLELGAAALMLTVGSAVVLEQVALRVWGGIPRAEAKVTDYATSWKAVRMLRVQFRNPSDPYNPVVSAANFGVAEWQVTGSAPVSGTKFKESWTIPGKKIDVTLQRSTTETDTFGYVYKVTGPNKADVPGNYALDYHAVGKIRSNGHIIFPDVRFLTVPAPGDAITERSWVIHNGSYGIKGAGQTAGNFFTHSTGSYGFTSSVDTGNGVLESIGTGSFLPLEWTINGKLCDAGEAVCN